jgi:hypothetical protein
MAKTTEAQILASGAKPLIGSCLVAVSEKVSTGQTQSAEQVQGHQDDQHQPDYPDASPRTPFPKSVIASAAAEQEQQENDQNDWRHGNLLSAMD